VRAVLPLIASAILLAPGCCLLSSRQVDLPPPTARETESGAEYVDLFPGVGTPVEEGDRIRLHYEGFLEDGTLFDSSVQRGVPVQLEVGAGEVVPGWEEGLLGLRPGGRRRLTIPPELAYGDEGLGAAIPPGATLRIEIQLLEILVDPEAVEATGPADPEGSVGGAPAP